MAGFAPLGFLVDRPGGDVPQRSDCPAVDADRRGGQLSTGGLVHERHELVGEAGHRATDADATDIGTAANAVDPATFGHVAFHDRAPAAEFDNAFGRAVLRGKIGLLVVAGAVAAFVHSR